VPLPSMHGTLQTLLRCLKRVVTLLSHRTEVLACGLTVPLSIFSCSGCLKDML